MTSRSLAQPRTVPNTRELRALDLVESHFEEIAASYRGGRYIVPSLHGEHTYDVIYTRDSESCSCRDWEFGHTCYHVLAAAVVRAKTGVCAGCGYRFRHRQLLEVGADSLAFFEGDQVCGGCACDHGIL